LQRRAGFKLRAEFKFVLRMQALICDGTHASNVARALSRSSIRLSLPCEVEVSIASLAASSNRLCKLRRQDHRAAVQMQRARSAHGRKQRVDREGPQGPQKCFPNLASFRYVDAESEIVLSKKDEAFQESRGIFGPLRLPVPPGPLWPRDQRLNAFPARKKSGRVGRKMLPFLSRARPLRQSLNADMRPCFTQPQDCQFTKVT
jgi:hypothetical protein